MTDEASPTPADFAVGTVANLIQRYIEEMAELKPMGGSHLYILRSLQRAPIGAKRAADLKKSDIIDHCKLRRKTVVPATVNQDITYLRGVLGYAGAAWEDCEDVSPAAITAAKPILNKYQLVGKSRPRDRRPLQSELDALLAGFDEQAKHKQSRIPMRAIVEFSLLSARRISETCRLRWGDVNGADMTCIVRDMKDPKNKKGNDHTFPLLGRAWDIVMAQPRMNPTNPDERIFKAVAKSAGAAYTRMKKKLGIVGLRLHDNRREAASRFIEGHPSFGGVAHTIPQAMVLTGHKNPNQLIRTYTRVDPKTLHPKEVLERLAAEKVAAESVIVEEPKGA